MMNQIGGIAQQPFAGTKFSGTPSFSGSPQFSSNSPSFSGGNTGGNFLGGGCLELGAIVGLGALAVWWFFGRGKGGADKATKVTGAVTDTVNNAIKGFKKLVGFGDDTAAQIAKLDKGKGVELTGSAGEKLQFLYTKQGKLQRVAYQGAEEGAKLSTVKGGGIFRTTDVKGLGKAQGRSVVGVDPNSNLGKMLAEKFGIAEGKFAIARTGRNGDDMYRLAQGSESAAFIGKHVNLNPTTARGINQTLGNGAGLESSILADIASSSASQGTRQMAMAKAYLGGSQKQVRSVLGKTTSTASKASKATSTASKAKTTPSKAFKGQTAMQKQLEAAKAQVKVAKDLLDAKKLTTAKAIQKRVDAATAAWNKAIEQADKAKAAAKKLRSGTTARKAADKLAGQIQSQANQAGKNARAVADKYGYTIS